MATPDNCIEKGYYFHKQKLGEGGFGTVKLATHLLTKQKVAIKIINKEKVGKDLFRVKTEIAALKTLRHKNIAKLLQIVEDECNIFLVMEYCSGGELFDYLVSRRRLSEMESRRIIKSLTQVLGYIHRHGFAHRDIKPENILFDASTNIKLIDFGLAANSEFIGGLDGLSTCCGSPAYVAPELLQGLKYSGPAADVWSVGVLMYILLTGTLPFDDQNLSLLYKKIKAGQFNIPPHVSSNARNLLKSMICVDPQKRIDIAGILAHPWINGALKPVFLPSTKTAAKPCDNGGGDADDEDDESSFNDQILLKCSALLLDDNLLQLRKNILNNYGYETATYWLVKANPSQFKDLEVLSNKKAINRRRSRSFSDFNSPSVAKVAGSANKRKEPDVECKNGNDHVSVKTTALTEVAKGKTYATTTLNRRTMAEKNSQVSKKLFTHLEDNSNSNDQTVSGKTTMITNATTTSNTTTPSNVSSYRRFFPRNTGTANANNNTPFKAFNSLENRLPDITPTKKSLFKRLLETATPRKLSSPRRFSSQDQSSQLKNMIVTNYKSVDVCKQKVLEMMAACNVNCKLAKNFTIRCVLSSRNVIIVAFELELLVCRITGLVGIHHNRLRGTSWDYLKICEELRKLSHPITETCQCSSVH